MTGPRYVPHGKVREWHAVSKRSLMDWVSRGYVRSAKLGDSRQSARLFNLSDIGETLERIASGRLPRRRRMRA